MNNTIFCFWTGSNDMSPNRCRCLKSLQTNSECKVVLVSQDNLADYVIRSFPLHPAYSYLSETHRSDYLRAYFMHLYGGGYSDIKETDHSWKNAFEELNKQEHLWAVGYPETRPKDVSAPPNEIQEFRQHWQSVIGNCAFIFKPHTPLTGDWIARVHSILDTKFDQLKKHPSKHPQDQWMQAPRNKLYRKMSRKLYPFIKIGRSKYPLRWTEIMGEILHPLSFQYKDRISQSLHKPTLKHYR